MISNSIIENTASKILATSGVTSAPVPLQIVADKFSVKIKKAPSKEFSGLLLRKDNVSYVGINSRESITRQRFTVAHELGHLFLHTKDDTFLDHIDYRDNSYGGKIKRSRQEIEANTFAAALLMPQKFLLQDFKDIETDLDDETVERLAQKYQVSKEAMNYRILNLGLKKLKS
jgi:Zn-dependent peptidase ImmA (M78 family)